MVAECTPAVEERVKALGALAPHAGYVFSGATAGRVFASVEVPPALVLLCPSHHYHSPPCALWTGGAWETPLGEVPPHEELCAALSELPVVTPDDRPHLPEHSGEVVLPFVQYHRPDVRIAVICVTGSATMQQLTALGQGIHDAVEACTGGEALVVASSDMSHEGGPQALDVVKAHDPLAIRQMERLDPAPTRPRAGAATWWATQA